MYLSQTLLASLMQIAQCVLIEAELVEHSGVNVAEVTESLHCAKTDLIGAPTTCPHLMPPPAIHMLKPRLW